MGKHPNQTKTFNKIRSWTELRSWLMKEMYNCPNEEILLLLMKSYNNQAKELK